MSDEEPSEESFRDRLEAIQERLDEAETEADLDDIEADIDALEAEVEDADLPDPDDEEETPPAEAIQGDIDAVAEDLEEERGPYGEDVVTGIEDAADTIDGGEWTEDGKAEVVESVEGFLAEADDHVDAATLASEEPEAAIEALEGTADAVDGAGLDPDEDADVIGALVEATDELADGLDDAEEWDDLTVRQQLDAQGFYDVLEHRKDFPPEWGALKVYEKRGEAEQILLALEKFESDFMERHCIEALERMGPDEALDEMLARAEKRNKPAIRVLGTIGSDEAVDTLLDYVDADVGLQKVTFQALGRIGSDEATQALADQLAAEEPEVRSGAARALGLVGDTRAIEPLAGVLEDTDEQGTVRASAAWALVQTGTEEALDVAGEYVDDREYLVQAEAEKARDAAA